MYILYKVMYLKTKIKKEWLLKRHIIFVMYGVIIYFFIENYKGITYQTYCILVFLGKLINNVILMHYRWQMIQDFREELAETQMPLLVFVVLLLLKCIHPNPQVRSTMQKVSCKLLNDIQFPELAFYAISLCDLKNEGNVI